jgi:hypothetical protein
VGSDNRRRRFNRTLFGGEANSIESNYRLECGRLPLKSVVGMCAESVVSPQIIHLNQEVKLPPAKPGAYLGERLKGANNL